MIKEGHLKKVSAYGVQKVSMFLLDNSLVVTKEKHEPKLEYRALYNVRFLLISQINYLATSFTFV